MEASNHLYLNYPSDSAGRPPDGPPTLVHLEALRHLASSCGGPFVNFSGKLRGHSLGQRARQEKSGVR